MANYAKGTGLTPLIIFRKHAERTLEIHYGPASNYTDSDDDVYDFVPVDGDSDAQNYVNQQGSYLRSQWVEINPNTPKIKEFINSLKQDISITAQIRIGLGYILNIDFKDCIDPEFINQYWNDLVSVYSSSWLTTKIQQIVLNYAVMYNIPLVPAPTPAPVSASLLQHIVKLVKIDV